MSSKMSWVAWAIPPESVAYTRPRKLLEELPRSAFADNLKFFHHGRMPTDARSTRIGIKGLARQSVSTIGVGAILSPIFLNALTGHSKWLDLYDDWSLARDINPIHRVLAMRGYGALSRSERINALVTVNSKYMAAKVSSINPGLNPLLVPNGVDPIMANYVGAGDEKRRIILMGSFHRGRADWNLLRATLRAANAEHLLVLGVSNGSKAYDLAREAQSMRGAEVVSIPGFVSMDDLHAMIGPNTVAVIPHRVSDYTLSQDLMKVYQFLALGVPVIAPRALWPSGVCLDYAHLLEVGVSLEQLLDYAWRVAGPTVAWRKTFVSQHSWHSRAKLVFEGLDC